MISMSIFNTMSTVDWIDVGKMAKPGDTEEEQKKQEAHVNCTQFRYGAEIRP